MSQPASACTSACLHQRLEGLVVEDHAVAHEAVVAVAVVGIERHVADDADVRHRLLDGADGAADEIVGVEGLARVGRLRRGSVSGKIAIAGMPRSRASLAARRARSTQRRSTPGIEAIGVRARSPSCTKTGQIRSSTESLVSATSRRDQSSGGCGAAGLSEAAKGRKAFAMGRNYSGSGRGKATAIIGIGPQSRPPYSRRSRRPASFRRRWRWRRASMRIRASANVRTFLGRDGGGLTEVTRGRGAHHDP